MYAETKPKLIQKIHIAKSQLGLDEFSYRAMLEMLTGKTSCKQMSVAELLNVQAHLKQRGFKVRSKKGNSPATANALVKSNITHKIRATWIAMAKAGIVQDGSEQALNKFMHHSLMKRRQNQPHALIKLNVQSLDDAEASQLLEILKKWKGRYE